LPGQSSELVVADVITGDVDVLFESSDLVLEAPNWNPGGQDIVMNSAGRLYRLRLEDTGALEEIGTGYLVDLNNDHLYSRDGSAIFVSSEGSGHLFSVPAGGGDPRRITPDHDEPFSYFLQGVSPDGRTLAYTGARATPRSDFDTYLGTIDTDGRDDRRRTHWGRLAVGFEYAPLGDWWYFNAELAARRPGDSQIFRMRPSGGEVEQLTHDDNVNWFPKLSPDGDRIVYLSYETGAVGHEANRHVEIRSMRPDGSEQRSVTRFFGGQGSLNVNSWAPDGERFAFMRYPVRKGL
jgi:Tol biopolymer transport system component